MIFAILFLIPAIVAITFFSLTKSSITLKEFLLHMACQAVIAGVSVSIIHSKNTSDVEILNGRVTNKSKDRVSCSHSYSCNCYEVCSGSGENRSCTTHCSTCYEHSYDISWRVHTDFGFPININRIDRQGLKEPPIWTSVKNHDPFSFSQSFKNYLKSSPDTLFRNKGLVKKYEKHIPEYPSKIYDYYKIDRMVVVGKSKVPDLKLWNEQLSLINRDLGHKKQVNMVVVLAYDLPREYFHALEEAWIGSKKNDVILVLGLNSQNEINWVDTMTWSSNELFKIHLRDRILDQKTLDRDLVLQSLSQEVEKGFIRRSLKDFEYLEASITPSVTELMVSLLVGLATSILLGVFLHKNDLFNEDRTYRDRRFY